jgi:TPR repeat protein
MYEFGDGIASDPSSASTVFSRGCTAGSAENCADMGDLIKTPEGSKLYLGDPNDYYRKACKLGHPEICEKLGISQ